MEVVETKKYDYAKQKYFNITYILNLEIVTTYNVTIEYICF